MYIEKVLDFRFQLMKNGGKNKSVAFIILFSVHTNVMLLKFQMLSGCCIGECGCQDK